MRAAEAVTALRPATPWIAEAAADLLLVSPPQTNSPHERRIPTQASV
jgi:hypothetical protein